MKQYELAVTVSNYNKNGNIFETIDSIKKAGFKNVFVEWFNNDYNWKISQEEQIEYVKKLGLNIIFAHLGYKNIDDLWIEEETDVVERYQRDIKGCHNYNIPLVIMHLTNNIDNPNYNEIGLKRIKKIVDYAESLGVKVAFENTKVKGYLEYVLGNIENKNVGVCFDSGHCHAFFNDEFNFDLFKDKIFAIHLHDNDQSSDLHLLPFDGTINWEERITKLINSGYTGPVTLEIHYFRQYFENMTIDNFYKEAYQRGLKLQKIFRNNSK